MSEELLQETEEVETEVVEEVDDKKELSVESLLTSEEREAIKYLNVDKNIRALKNRMNDINSDVNAIIKNSSDLDILDAAVAEYTVEQIKAMDPVTLQRIYTIEETDSPMELDIEIDDKDYVEFMRDYLILRKETAESNSKFEEEISKLEKEIEENQEEFEKAIKEFSNITNIISDRMKVLAEEGKDEQTREFASNILKALDDALHLTTLKEFVKSYKYGTDTLRLFRDPEESIATYNRYLEVSKKIGCDKDFIVFRGLENNHLEEKYHKRPNMFVFTIMHMVATWRRKYDTDPYYGLMLTQLYVNLRNLYTNRFDTDEQKEIFVSAIKEVLDVHL